MGVGGGGEELERAGGLVLYPVRFALDSCTRLDNKNQGNHQIFGCPAVRELDLICSRSLRIQTKTMGKI